MDDKLGEKPGQDRGLEGTGSAALEANVREREPAESARSGDLAFEQAARKQPARGPVGITSGGELARHSAGPRGGEGEGGKVLDGDGSKTTVRVAPEKPREKAKTEASLDGVARDSSAPAKPSVRAPANVAPSSPPPPPPAPVKQRPVVPARPGDEESFGDDASGAAAPDPAPSRERAQDAPAADKPAVDVAQLTRQARSAALKKQCSVVQAIAKKVRTADPAYYRSTFAVEPTIKPCL